MKLKRENFRKEEILNTGVRYIYRCNETDFFLEVLGVPKITSIHVFKGSLSERQDMFTTTDSLEAWNTFEAMLDECSPKQGSSGGFANKPMENPNILPLLAIKYQDFVGDFSVILFVVTKDKQQESLMEFVIPFDKLPQPITDEVVEVDWSSLEIPMLFKCEVILKRYSAINFEQEPDRQVFLFIPKSIVNQGGEEGGVESDGKGEESDGEGQEGKGKGKGKGKKSDKKQEGSEGEGEGEGEESDEEGQEGKGKGKGKGEKSDKKEEGSEGEGDGEGEESDEEKGQGEGEGDGEGEGEESGGEGDQGKNYSDEGSATAKASEKGGSGKGFKMNFSDIIVKLSEITDVQPSVIAQSFERQRLGELWLSTNNFAKIKKELGLAGSETPASFAKQIINAKNQ